MRLIIAVGIGSALCAGDGSAQFLDAASAGATLAPSIVVAADTAATVRFHIPAQPLTDALGEFSRQAGVRVQVDLRAASAARSRAVSGSFKPADALQRLLAETGLYARFADGRTALVTGDAINGRAPHALTPITVTGQRTSGYAAIRSTTATKTDTPLRDTPQSVSVLTSKVIADQAMQSMADVVRYVPGVSMGQGEGHRDAPTLRGNSSTADFFVNGVRDDVQYLRDLYNVERVEALKGPTAMIFGRGGGGGVLNRVTKEANWLPTRMVTVEGGSFDHKRTVLDLGDGFGAGAAGRVTAMYENSGGFRDNAGLRRWGVNPTLAVALGAGTTLRAGYEHFLDRRTVDRGIPSFEGRPAPAAITTYFGNPDSSYARAEVGAAAVVVEHVTGGGFTVRNHTRLADYQKFYQNSFPGAVNAAGTQVNLAAYNLATDRRNLFNQTDVIFRTRTGSVQHTILGGFEFGQQQTDNFRQTGYYNNTATVFAAPFDQPTIAAPITFRQSATDADNHTTANVAAVYLQDQIELGRFWQAIGGVRFDRFAVDFHDNRADEDLAREDNLVSPRAGLVFKPVDAASLYGSFSVSYLPSSGDQFSSLSASTETLEPEQFTNYEVGAKWDVLPNLALSAAVYRLDRTNTSAPDPSNPSLRVQTGSQRSTGLELGGSGYLTPLWEVIGGIALQKAEITSTTLAADEGAEVPLVPARTLSLWNRVQVLPALGIGVGVVHRSDMYAAIDNTVTLPGFTRADAGVFLRLSDHLGAQVNVENLFNQRYYSTSHGNNNIMPGAPRTLLVSLTTRR